MTVKSLRGVKNTNKKKKQAGVGFSVEGRGGGLGLFRQCESVACIFIQIYKHIYKSSVRWPSALPSSFAGRLIIINIFAEIN